MKKLTLIAAASLVLAASAAQAAQPALPKQMIGRWCALLYNDSIGTGWFDPVSSEEEWATCRQGDGYLTVTPTGYSAHETKCRFVKIRNTGRKSVPYTKALPSELVPIMSVTALCRQESDNYTTTFRISYQKASLVIEEKKP